MTNRTSDILFWLAAGVLLVLSSIGLASLLALLFP